MNKELSISRPKVITKNPSDTFFINESQTKVTVSQELFIVEIDCNNFKMLKDRILESHNILFSLQTIHFTTFTFDNSLYDNSSYSNKKVKELLQLIKANIYLFPNLEALIFEEQFRISKENIDYFLETFFNPELIK